MQKEMPERYANTCVMKANVISYSNYLAPFSCWAALKNIYVLLIHLCSAFCYLLHYFIIEDSDELFPLLHGQ